MYLITQPGTEPFLTNYFYPSDHFVEGMIVYCIYGEYAANYTINGIDWNPVNVDHL